MCNSYGLDPRFKDSDFIADADERLLGDLRTWAETNGNEILRPTGKNLKNLNPIVTAPDGALTMELAWWGYLVNGAPMKFSTNTRSERLKERKGPLRGRAIVPATSWLEMQKPSRQWFSFDTGHLDLFGMAAMTQTGRTTEGQSYTCYSIVMQDAAPQIFELHDRMPLLIPADFAHEWLTSEENAGSLVEAAAQASQPLSDRIGAHPTATH